MLHTYALAFILMFSLASTAYAGTLSPGHEKQIQKDGYPKGMVNGNFHGYLAYDSTGAFYWDIGMKPAEGSVRSVYDLDQETLTECSYVVNFRGFLNIDTGDLWGGSFQNHIRCFGYDFGDTKQTYNFAFVDQYDNRYDGDPDRAIFSSANNVWEYTDLNDSGLTTDEIAALIIFPGRR